MVYCANKLIENLKLFYKSNRPHFLRGFTGVITHLGCWENNEKLVNHELVFTSFSCVLPTSQVSVVYCLTILFYPVVSLVPCPSGVNETLTNLLPLLFKNTN